MKFFDSIKFYVAAFIVAGFTFAACGDDEDDPKSGLTDTYYEGTAIVTGSMRGQEMMRDTITASIGIAIAKDGSVILRTTPINNLEIPQMKMLINMDSFQIEGLNVSQSGDSTFLTCEEYLIPEVYCSYRENEAPSAYETTGTVSGVICQKRLELNYSFKLGKMPFPIEISFKGK